MTTSDLQSNAAGMRPMASLISTATDEMRQAVEPVLNRDWSLAAGDLEWSCRQTATHIADDLFSYASQVVAQPAKGYLPIEAVSDPEASPEELVRCVAMCGELLRLAVTAASPDARAGHPYGTSDPEGFAAMGVVEVLVHTYDITRGLGVEWAPPSGLSEPVLARLFPDAPPGDPSAVLLWSTGRTELVGRPRLADWRWDSSIRTDDAK
ncbi:mycothiol maleylpyruvate isomerase-like protein [Oryzihumus leptocrescens]|uniref:Mycothiol maleylpyruvate isomerase-like protein n=2 Tax=Oryzihumus leptocrescens TaxID=297536 RepID=A0A542ZH86_9MICO|nr:mycothiol maleylpyruvate isomerase-like protein [Oryzihumus leptocrescens]